MPVADAHVSSSNVGGNYGTITTVKVREGDGSTANPNYRGYFKFNLSGISGTVSSVKLRLFVTDTTTDLQSVFVVTDNSWTETGITYTNAPTLTGLTAVGSAAAPDGRLRRDHAHADDREFQHDDAQPGGQERRHQQRRLLEPRRPDEQAPTTGHVPVSSHGTERPGA